MKRLYFLMLIFFVHHITISAQNKIVVDAVGNNLKSRIGSIIRPPVALLFDKSFKNDDTIYISLDGKSGILKGCIGDDIQKYEMTGMPGFLIREDSTIKINNVKIKLETGTIFLGLNNKNFIGPIKIKAYKHSYVPGLVLYDVFKLKEIKDADANDSLLSLGAKILAYYGINKDNLNKNAFLKATIKGIDLATFGKIQGLTKESVGSAFKTASSIGGLDVTTIADGFAKFIVKRTKQELSIAFFDKFKDDLDSIKDIQTVFPQTYRTLSAIGEEIYMYEAYIQTLRESFEKDLASLPSNLPSIIDNHPDFFDKAPELKAALLSSFYIAEGIQNKQHIGEIIENFPIDNFDNESTEKGTIQSLKLISTSFRSITDSLYWAPYSDIKKLYTDDWLLKVYMGLLEQKAKTEKIVFKDKNQKPFYLADKIEDSYNFFDVDLPKYKSYIKEFAFKTQSLETKIRGLKKIKNDSLLFENYYSVISSSVDIMKYAVKIEDLPILSKDSLCLKKKTGKYFDLVQTAADVSIDINRRNYSSAIANIVHIYDLVISRWNISKEEYDETLKKIKKIVDDNSILLAAQTGYIPSKITIVLTNKQINELQPYIDKIHYFRIYKESILKKDAINKILRYGSFMATVAQAKSSDDVETAIEVIVLPTGSARIKRETAFNVSLNAYCGLFVGQERERFWSAPKYAWGVTAPIGISASWGICKHSSISIFASVFDLGAITTFRFVNDSAKVASKIQLKDILSPGLFVSWGFPKTPISVNFGYQITPLLKEVNADKNAYQRGLSRFTFGVCVDLPVLNLYTKPKKR